MVAFNVPCEDESVKLELMCKLTDASAELMLSISHLETISSKYQILKSIVEMLGEAAMELR
jgi:hypothetical protein